VAVYTIKMVYMFLSVTFANTPASNLPEINFYNNVEMTDVEGDGTPEDEDVVMKDV
jgi:hypothetical protein